MIRVLEDAVVDQIAAGEVVERPASVLKELVENALDAGARRLELRLKGGGADLVRVTDDGRGMDRDDALLCIERHATSKIRSADDLLGVATLGFRGEALPSIASVSRMELRTRRAEDELGTLLRLDGGRLEHVGPHAGPPGTDIAVRALFGHVPARRKFLRSRQTELAHCVEQVHRQVIRRPEVDVTVWHDGREVLRAPATDDLARRVRDLLGPDADGLVPVQATSDRVRVEGLVSPVGVHRPASAGAVYTFVNGRFVRDPVVRRALQDAYRGMLPQGRHPVVVLDLGVPPGFVDVNVHPAKTEVRFRSPREVMAAVAEAIQEALAVPRPRPVRGSAAHQAPPGQLELGRPPADPRPPVDPLPSPDDAARWILGAPDGPAPPALPEPSPRAAAAAGDAPPVGDPVVPPPAEDRPVAPRPPPPAPRPPTPSGGVQVVGEAAVAPHGDGLLVVDLAAAQARRLLARLGEGSPSEPLLVPVRVTPGRREAALVIDHAEALSALGVEVTAVGPGELAVVGVPAGVPVDDPAALLAAVVVALDRGGPAALPDAIAGAASVDPADAPALVAWVEARPPDERAGLARVLSPADLLALVKTADG